MWNDLTVNGFHFDNAGEYADAKKENETIEYISSKMNLSDPEVAFKVYYKLLERQNLHTIVGFSFLKELRDRIIKSGIIKEEELRSINAPKVTLAGKTEDKSVGDETSLEIGSLVKENSDVPIVSQDITRSKSKEKRLKAVADYYRLKNKRCYIVITALIFVIIIFIGISYYRGNLNFDDAEVAVQNKYSAWAEELAEKEALLDARAKELERHD